MPTADHTREAKKIWDALSPMISQLVSRQTRSCVRARKMQVDEPPNGSVIGVSEPYGNTVRVPYSAALQAAKAGDAVWVMWFFDNASTMIAVATGEGQMIPDYDSISTPFILASDPPAERPDPYTVWLDTGVTPPLWRLWKGLDITTGRTDGGWEDIGGGSGGGTSDYLNLVHKPSVNSVTLEGNKTLSDLGIQPAGSYQPAGTYLTPSDVDSSLSSSSTNPVQNQAIKAALDDKADASAVPTATSDLLNDSGFITSSDLPGDMTGASAGSAGAHGLVPAPAAGDNTKYLRGDGSWQDVSGGGGGLTFDDIYPVGSIYMSVNSANPGTLFGGTWTQIQDTFLLAAGSTYTAGSTGGEAAHTLTTDEMPAHNHKVKKAKPDNTGNYSTDQVQYGKPNGTTYTNYNSMSNEGGGQAHNNMPPYLAVYCWQRTA